MEQVEPYISYGGNEGTQPSSQISGPTNPSILFNVHARLVQVSRHHFSPSHLAAIDGFMKEHGDGHVLCRTFDELVMAATAGCVQTIETQDEILAAGLVEVIEGYFELGGAVVARRFRGIGLQPLLIKTRLAAIAMFHGLDVNVVSVPTGESSERNLQNSGFRRLTSYPEVLRARCLECPNHRPSEPEWCCGTLFGIDHEPWARTLTALQSYGPDIILGRQDSFRIRIDLSDVGLAKSFSTTQFNANGIRPAADKSPIEVRL